MKNLKPLSLFGLSSKEASLKLRTFGFNEIEEKKAGIVVKFLRWLISPVSLMLLLAAALSFYLQKAFDGYFISCLWAINFFIKQWHEGKADKAIKKLKEKLAIQVRVRRDNDWQMLEAKNLVPGDLIELDVGNLVPADAELIQTKNLSLNESALTGESLPKEKADKDGAFSGSFVTTGWALAKVTTTGKNSSFGKTLMSVEQTKKRSLLEKDILTVSSFLSVLSFVAVILLTVLFLFQHQSFTELITLDLGLVIAGIPISLPTVITLIISLGVLRLAHQNIIVRRISALEDLANVNLLLSDKTGTLTKNELSINRVVAYPPFKDNDVLYYALAVAGQAQTSPIEKAIINKTEALNLKPNYRVLDFTPADSERKRGTAIIQEEKTRSIVVTGATQVVETLLKIDPKQKALFENDVAKFAGQGFRGIAVAMAKNQTEEKNLKLAGFLLVADTLRPDSREAIDFLNKNGIGVKMLTGDNLNIGRYVAKQLGLPGEVAQREVLATFAQNPLSRYGIFAEILPEDKLKLVEAAKKTFRVAVTGDGVNDLPAIKAADVGIAVSNAVDALKSAADIVLLSPGINVIRQAIIEARKIFTRIYSYSVYRISESFRLIITIAVLGILYRVYPLTAIQLILLALLNDVPIISLAFDRVKLAGQPSAIKVKERFLLSSLFGLTGVVNSLLMFFITNNLLHLPWGVIETLFFLKLTIGGHMLIYVTHTKEAWYKYLPSRQVIWATFLTQGIATIFALFGLFMPKVPVIWIVAIWLWAFLWMQISELMKPLQRKLLASMPALTK